MPAYIFKLPDKFDLLSDPSFINAETAAAEKERKPVVRRPLRGTERKVDTYASLKIVSSSKKAAKVKNSSDASGESEYYYNFMLQGYTEQRLEKSQIIETFGQSYVYFFGERTALIQFQGILLNTQDFNWKEEFLANYDQFFRGTKLVSKGYRAFIRVGDDLIGGYLSNMSVVNSTSSPEEVPFTFELIVTDRAILDTGSRNTLPPESVPKLKPEYRLQETPAQAATKPLGTFESVLRSVRDGYTATTDFLNSVSRQARSILLGRNIRVPPNAAFGESGFSVRTRSVSLAGGTVKVSDLIRGEKIKVIEAKVDYGNPVYTGKVTDNRDEYIDGYDEYAGIAAAEKAFAETTAVTKTDQAKLYREFLKKNGVSTIEVDGIPVWARLLGRVGYGVLNTTSPTIIPRGPTVL